jgi:hypothetical protein
MRLHTKVVATTRQQPATARASTLVASACPTMVSLKFVTNEDRHAALQKRKGLAGTKLGLDKDVMPTL